MKWRLIIPIWTFTCIAFSTSFPLPIFVQDEMAIMYPMEFYPGFTQTDSINLDFAKWFRKAADSVRHFYNYVNTLLFGQVAREPIFVRYPTFNKNTNGANDSQAENKVHSQELKADVNGIKAFEIYKDADGNMFVKNLNDPNGGLQLLRPVKSSNELKQLENRLVNEDPKINNIAARNPFQWNEALEKDKFFGAFQSYAVNPQLLWHSGIFPFQPLRAFNIMSGMISDQNQPAQNLSSEPPSSSSDTLQNEETSSQKIQQTEPPSTPTTDQSEPEITTHSEEFKNEESPDSSNSSDDEKMSSQSSNESNPYEVVMEIERIKQNNSNSDASNNAEQSDPESNQDSDIFDETADEDSNGTDTDDNNDDDDDDGDLGEFVTEPIFSDDDSDQEPEINEKTSEVTNDETTNGTKEDSTIMETSAPSEGTETIKIFEETTNAKMTENNPPKQNSDELDIMNRVLAIVHPSKN